MVINLDKGEANCLQWQDISTAPRDGTEIIGWYGHYMYFIKFVDGDWFVAGFDESIRPPQKWRERIDPPSV